MTQNEMAPCLVTLVDDLGCILFVLGLARERKGVLALSIRNLVDPVFIRQQAALEPEKKVKRT